MKNYSLIVLFESMMHLRRIFLTGLVGISFIGSGVSLTGCAFAPGSYLVSSVNFSTDYELIDLSRAPESVLNEISKEGMLEGKNPDYRITVGDSIAVTLWSVPEFHPSTAFGTTFTPMGRTVEPDGSIFLPYAGQVKVAGLTVPQAREQIFSALRKTVKDPQFDIRLGGRAYLMGEFLSIQPLDINNTFTVADAITQARGVIQLATDGSIFLIRPRGNKEPVVYRLNLNNPRSASLATQILLRPQDTVYAGTSDLAKFNRVFSNLLPGLGAARQVQDFEYRQRTLNAF